MVAITVILAAVIGAFVLGLGPGAEPAPSATPSLDEGEDGNVTITHNGGGTLDLTEFTLVGETQQELSGTLAPGESTEEWEVEANGQVSLHHDPSGSIIATEDFS